MCGENLNTAAPTTTKSAAPDARWAELSELLNETDSAATLPPHGRPKAKQSHPRTNKRRSTHTMEAPPFGPLPPLPRAAAASIGLPHVLATTRAVRSSSSVAGPATTTSEHP